MLTNKKIKMKLSLSKLDLGILVLLNTAFPLLFFFSLYMTLSTQYYSMFIPTGFFFLVWNLVYYMTVKEIVKKIIKW